MWIRGPKDSITVENLRNSLSVTLQKTSVSPLNQQYLQRMIHATGHGMGSQAVLGLVQADSILRLQGLHGAKTCNVMSLGGQDL